MKVHCLFPFRQPRISYLRPFGIAYPRMNMPGAGKGNIQSILLIMQQ